MTSVAQVRGIEILSQADLRRLVDVSKRLGIDPDWLAAVISFETGGTFSTSIKNRYSGATGLIQFMPVTAQKLLNTSTKEQAVYLLGNMSFQQQMQYVEKYFNSYKGRMKSLNDTYLAVFYPAAMRTADSNVVANEGTAVYTQNAGFDKTKKGYITTGDITRTVNSVLNSATGRIEVKEPIFFQVLGGLLVAGFGYASYYTYKHHNTSIRKFIKNPNTSIKKLTKGIV